MPTIHTASRLHFGLFHLGDEPNWPNCHGDPVHPARRFGGVGLMIKHPGLTLQAEPARDWSFEGPLAARLREAVPNITSQIDHGIPPLALTVESKADEHTGLGIGTQLELALACLVTHSVGLSLSPEELANLADRGNRSALGIHGFARGGFLVEGGKRHPEQVAPLLSRIDFPEDWPILLLTPPVPQGRHGQAERIAFEQLVRDSELATTDTLCRLVLLGMLPALAEGDSTNFGEALYDFNRRVGEMFAPIQGGPYSDPLVESLVGWLRDNDALGVGQSSWGPSVFAICADNDHRKFLEKKIREHPTFSVVAITPTVAMNRGAWHLG